MEESKETITEEMSFLEINGYVHTQIFEDVELRKALRDGTMGNFDATVRVFSAGKVNLDPSIDELPFGVGVDRVLNIVEEEAQNEFYREMRRQDLDNVQIAEAGEAELSHTTVRYTGYTAEFQYDSMTVPLEGMDDIEIDGGRLQVNGLLTVWHDGTDAIIAGGAYPAETFEETIQRDMTDMVSVTIDIDLQLDPDRYHNELLDLIGSVR